VAPRANMEMTLETRVDVKHGWFSAGVSGLVPLDRMAQ
jgi:hypothetical protein